MVLFDRETTETPSYERVDPNNRPGCTLVYLGEGPVMDFDLLNTLSTTNVHCPLLLPFYPQELGTEKKQRFGTDLRGVKGPEGRTDREGRCDLWDKKTGNKDRSDS